MNCQIAETEINLLKFTVLEYDLRTDDGRWYCQLDFDNCVTINTNNMYAGALTSIDMMVKIMDPLFFSYYYTYGNLCLTKNKILCIEFKIMTQRPSQQSCPTILMGEGVILLRHGKHLYNSIISMRLGS